MPRSLAETVCNYCQASFRHPPCQQRRYCSSECFQKARAVGRIEVVSCQGCGKGFRACISDRRKHCSAECANSVRPPAKQENHCKGCGHEFTSYAYTKRKYCSEQCYNASRGQGKHEVRSCATCGTSFRFLKSQHDRKYCSGTCAGKAHITHIKKFAPSRYTATCETCGKSFETTAKRTKGRFCSLACQGQWQSVARRGENSPSYGKKRGRDPRHPPLVELACVICETAFKVPQCLKDTRRCCSRRCKGKLHSRTVCGPDHPNWQGGGELYYGPNWNTQRRKAIKRDGHRCIDCGIDRQKLRDELNQGLCVHHIKPFRLFGIERYKEANHLENLATLCPSCHHRWEWRDNRPRKKRKTQPTTSPL